ncbi:MAG: YHS domain-containing protein [Bacteroidia bacterium]
MKIHLLKLISIVAVCLIFSSKVIAQTNAKDVYVDPVCGKKVDKAESYDWTYAGKKYYFANYDCRASFKMNPQLFLLKNCVKDNVMIDPVCGMKVNKEESYDWKYKEKMHYFDTYECRETFKTNPDKFLKNICAPKDSVK